MTTLVNRFVTRRGTVLLRALAIATIGAVAVAAWAVAGRARSAPGADGGDRGADGVLVMAHGGDPEWNKRIEGVAAPLREQWPTEIAFGMADPDTMEDAVRALESRGVRRIAVVRLFVSGQSFLNATEFNLGLRTDMPAPTGMPAHAGANPHAGSPAKPAEAKSGRPAHAMKAPRAIASESEFLLSRTGLAESPLVAGILADRVRALSKNPAEESVLVLAHGPASDDENARWKISMDAGLEEVRKLGAFIAVRAETLREDWPEKRKVAETQIRDFVTTEAANGRRVIVVPFRVAGFGPYAKVLEGLSYVSDGVGFCPHENVTAWLREQAAQLFAGAEVAAR